MSQLFFETCVYALFLFLLFQLKKIALNQQKQIDKKAIKMWKTSCAM